MRSDFVTEDGRVLGSCTFPGFAGGELVNIEATLNGWTLLLRHQSPKVLEKPERGSAGDELPIGRSSPPSQDGNRRCGNG